MPRLRRIAATYPTNLLRQGTALAVPTGDSKSGVLTAEGHEYPPKREFIFAAANAFAIVALLFTLAVPVHAQQPSARGKAIDDRIMCMCGGCADAAGKCTHMGGAFAGPCETAQKEMKETEERISAGQSDDLVLQSFVQEYGPTVLITPPASGFNFWAWAMPAIIPILGLLLVWFFVMRWRKRVALAGAPPVSPELLARARREMGDDAP